MLSVGLWLGLGLVLVCRGRYGCG